MNVQQATFEESSLIIVFEQCYIRNGNMHSLVVEYIYND
jgi:hypothetical protein